MNYNLNYHEPDQHKTGNIQALRKMLHFLADERGPMIMAFLVMVTNSALTLAAPWMLGYAIDHYIRQKDFNGLLGFAGLLILLFVLRLATEYLQTKWMGAIGQRTLFRLRNAVFGKIQEMPMAFFNQNKAGDLISRINNDTDKINQFFAQSLVQFADLVLTIIGAIIVMLSINTPLGLSALSPAVLILLFSILITPWVKKKNTASLQTTGNLSAAIQEGLSNFRAVIAFNRRSYFREQIAAENEANYKTSVWAGIANNVFLPVYTFFSNMAQLIVLITGIYFIMHGRMTIGLLVSYIGYTTNFYNPLRQLAALWASFQVAMAGWERISRLLELESDMKTIASPAADAPEVLMELRDVNFGYTSGQTTLKNASLIFEKGKTYALVGPTGGGKTTTAYLLARLYDPGSGEVYLNGKNLKSYSDEERTAVIGYILQDPYIFSGSLQDNICFGNAALTGMPAAAFKDLLHQKGWDRLMDKFRDDWERPQIDANSLSLGQKQIIAFMRAILRNPQLLILDEATANIDTITEDILSEIIHQLPAATTKVIIAHRLNTIANADEIYFVNNGSLVNAGSFENAVKMIMEEKRAS